MLFELTLLREQGRRLERPEKIYVDAHISSERTNGYMFLHAHSYGGGISHKAAPLFEAKLIKMTPEEIIFLGFEQIDGRAYVQEWKLCATSRQRTNWLTHAEASQASKGSQHDT